MSSLTTRFVITTEYDDAIEVSGIGLALDKVAEFVRLARFPA